MALPTASTPAEVQALHRNIDELAEFAPTTIHALHVIVEDIRAHARTRAALAFATTHPPFTRRRVKKGRP